MMLLPLPLLQVAAAAFAVLAAAAAVVAVAALVAPAVAISAAAVAAAVAAAAAAPALQMTLRRVAWPQCKDDYALASVSGWCFLLLFCLLFLLYCMALFSR